MNIKLLLINLRNENPKKFLEAWLHKKKSLSIKRLNNRNIKYDEDLS